MKIGAKLMLIMVVLNFLSVSSISIVLLMRSCSNDTDLAGKYALGLGEKGASNVKTYFEDYWHTIETTAEVMEQYHSMTLMSRESAIVT